MNEHSLRHNLEKLLLEKYGPLLTGEDLRIALGFPSLSAFRQALLRKRVPVPVFSLPQRHGKFALSSDIAAWLAEQRDRVAEEGR